MKIVTVQAHYGESVFISQCSRCGGLWFDSDELYRINPTEADKLDAVDLEKIKAYKEIASEPLTCPRDGQKLVVFHDINFPQNLVIESCPHCGGFWFNHGEFKKLEEFREEKIKKLAPKEQNLDPKLKEQIDKLLSLHSNENTLNTLNKVARFLSTPVQREGTYFGSDNAAEKTANVAGTVLVSVLRGIVGRI